MHLIIFGLHAIAKWRSREKCWKSIGFNKGKVHHLTAPAEVSGSQRKSAQVSASQRTLSWCILFKESVLLHWSNEILTFSNVSMISEWSWILQCTQNPFNVIWKKYEKPCAILTVCNLSMISECSGMSNCWQHTFNVIWSGFGKVRKTLCDFNIFNWLMISECSGVVVKWAPYATYKSIKQ